MAQLPDQSSGIGWGCLVLPPSAALGVTGQRPESERHLYTESYPRTRHPRLGGRVAETLVLGDPSTGASKELSDGPALVPKRTVHRSLVLDRNGN
jgi:ATP-dependent Zn protease